MEEWVAEGRKETFMSAARLWSELNVITGEPLREEATPGNLLFRPTARGTEVLWHDVDCVEHLLATLPTRAL